MSRSVRYDLHVRAEVRRREYLARVSDTTSHYHARFVDLIADLAQQGLDQYLPGEFSRVRSQLAQLGTLLQTDPERARELSMALGAEVSRLPAMARSAQREFQGRERQRREELAAMRRQASTEMAQFLQSLIAEITDPIEQDFAFDALRSVQSDNVGRVVEPHESSRVKDELRQRVQAIRSAASLQATVWKDRNAKDTSGESQQTLIGLHRDEAARDADHNPKAMQAMLASLDAMRVQVTGGGCSMTDVQRQIAEAAGKADAAVVDENCRRATVRAILESLEKAGFAVGVPQRQVGDVDEVVILARKPAGAEASFRVTADGGMTYKFDHYEGSKCKSDIDQVLPLLQDVYGIELSNERVLWQNPDRISKSARPIDDGGKEQHRG